MNEGPKSESQKDKRKSDWRLPAERVTDNGGDTPEEAPGAV